jgi:hypothetical protein
MYYYSFSLIFRVPSCLFKSQNREIGMFQKKIVKFERGWTEVIKRHVRGDNSSSCVSRKLECQSYAKRLISSGVSCHFHLPPHFRCIIRIGSMRKNIYTCASSCRGYWVTDKASNENSCYAYPYFKITYLNCCLSFNTDDSCLVPSWKTLLEKSLVHVYMIIWI